MKQDFEVDKIVISIALAIFILIFSSAVGGFVYRTDQIILKKGFRVDLTDIAPGSDTASQGIPTVIEIGKIMSTANAEAGKIVFNKCAVCHTDSKDEHNKVGPNLWQIIGSKIARRTDFQYSSAMAVHGADEKIWTYEELYRYLYSPKAYVPGTKMAFAGLKKDEDRANLIAYLRSQADAPLPLPPIEK